jgi:hypothetical protein
MQPGDSALRVECASPCSRGLFQLAQAPARRVPAQPEAEAIPVLPFLQCRQTASPRLLAKGNPGPGEARARSEESHETGEVLCE